MMRLPRFTLVRARSIVEVVETLAKSPATTMLLAGGTDLVPNMKRRQQTPSTVVSLRGVKELCGLGADNGAWTIGTGQTLTSLVQNEELRRDCPGLWQAASSIATPHLRNMGTVGGNLCLDTRCTYYDQSAEWRKSIGYCMKKEGTTCWVATSSPTCLAVSSTDLAPMLIALGARVRLASTQGLREIAVDDLYVNDGMHYLTRRPDEIMTDVFVPDQRGWASTYVKVRRRGSIDFPVASAGVAIKRGPGGVVEDARVVLGAVASRPLVVAKAATILTGQPLSNTLIEQAADAAHELAKPMDNTDFELHWRKRIVRSMVRNALSACVR